MENYLNSDIYSLVLLVIAIALYAAILIVRRRAGKKGTTVENRAGDELSELHDSFISLIGATKEQQELMRKLSSGDWAVRPELRSDKDELMMSVSSMTEEVRATLTGVKEAAGEVLLGAEYISDASASVSNGATQSTVALEKISLCMQEIKLKTSSNAENTKTANTLAFDAQKYVKNGSMELESLLTVMNEMSVSSQAVARILKVIEDIAFQTNLLALNAAVEAAHAGSHGRGFAVVAEEVRNLAIRSSKSAQDTGAIVETALRNSSSGTDIANRSALALRQIFGNVKEVASLLDDISKASSEQVVAVSEVMNGFEHISQVVLQNSANAEETASAAHQLKSYSSKLNEAIDGFKL